MWGFWPPGPFHPADSLLALPSFSIPPPRPFWLLRCEVLEEPFHRTLCTTPLCFSRDSMFVTFPGKFWVLPPLSPTPKRPSHNDEGFAMLRAPPSPSSLHRGTVMSTALRALLCWALDGTPFSAPPSQIHSFPDDRKGEASSVSRDVLASFLMSSPKNSHSWHGCHHSPPRNSLGPARTSFLFFPLYSYHSWTSRHVPFLSRSSEKPVSPPFRFQRARPPSYVSIFTLPLFLMRQLPEKTIQ